MSLQNVLSALGDRVARQGNEYRAKCPSHEDRQASLMFRQGDDGRVLLKCHAGCETSSVVEAMGLKMSDLFPEEAPRERRVVATYEYRNADGVLQFRKLRYEPKGFAIQNAAGGWTLEGWERVLYRMPQLRAADADDPVFVVEGEKDADNLAKLGLVATTNFDGAGKWRENYADALRGRHVVILPDNDKPGLEHAANVAKALEGHAVSVRIVRLPGLAEKGDVSDWLAAGGTRERLFALVDKARTAEFMAPAVRMVGERDERVREGRQILSFGVRFLDEALGGIMPSDIVLYGAKTGIGKTSLATITALHNCQQGKRVHFFALEAEDREIERRMKFQIIADLYYGNRDLSRHQPSLRYQDWRRGALEYELGSYENTADMELGRVLKNLRTYYRIGSFSTDDFRAQLERIKDETDLVILDHLHYVDIDDENENRGYKKTLKAIRDGALETGKPVILVAHVRKGDRRLEPLVPTAEDFHGSSDIVKVATKAVMLAPAYEMKSTVPHLWHTFMQVAKNRTDGSVTRYVALTMFDARKSTYADQYSLGRLTDAGKTFAALVPADMPAWANQQKGRESWQAQY
jgi:hypothetical protein